MNETQPSIQPVSAPAEAPEIEAPKKKTALLAIITIILFLALAGGAFGYMYVEKLGVFSISRYTEETFLSSLLAKSAEVKSSSYKVSGALNMGPREAGAEAFKVHVTNEAEQRQKYQNDYTRAQNVSSILYALNSKIPSTYNPKATGLPLTITNLFSDPKNTNNYYTRNASVKDPATDVEYEYTLSDDGDYRLGVTFETADAIRAIKRYGYVATTTIINGLKVEFTKKSYTYLYLSTEPPKPFLVEVSDQLAYAPTDMNVSFTVSASTNWKSTDVTDWLFNMDASGSFGDLTYKVNADALKKDKDYYFKINNIPSLFGGDISSVKGKWIKVSPQPTSTDPADRYSYDAFSEISREFPDMEKNYKETRAKGVKFIKLFTSIADSEKLIKFKTAPTSEKIDGRNLVRYELDVRKEAILPFYTKLLDSVNKDSDLIDYRTLFVDEGLLDYLKSEEFDQVFDYYSKNKKLVLWTDENGFPAIVEQTFRVVPPDTAKNLKDKQANLIFRIVLSDINVPIEIKAPSPATPIEDIIKDAKANQFGNDVGGIAALKSNLGRVRSEAELVYGNTTPGGYGKNPFALGTCTAKFDTLFGDKLVFDSISAAMKDGGGAATCVSKVSSKGTVDSYAVSVPLKDSPDYSWCIDSTGNSKQIKGAIVSDICK